MGDDYWGYKREWWGLWRNGKNQTQQKVASANYWYEEMWMKCDQIVWIFKRSQKYRCGGFLFFCFRLDHKLLNVSSMWFFVCFVLFCNTVSTECKPSANIILFIGCQFIGPNFYCFIFTLAQSLHHQHHVLAPCSREKKGGRMLRRETSPRCPSLPGHCKS